MVLIIPSILVILAFSDHLGCHFGNASHILEIFDVVVRLLAASVVHSVVLRKIMSLDGGALINAIILAYLMEQCQSLKLLTLKYLVWHESQIGVLGTFSRPDLKIELDTCQLTSAGTSALAEVLGRNQGPTKLQRCDIDNILRGRLF
jgi:hypothetical protein